MNNTDTPDNKDSKPKVTLRTKGFKPSAEPLPNNDGTKAYPFTGYPLLFDERNKMPYFRTNDTSATPLEEPQSCIENEAGIIFDLK